MRNRKTTASPAVKTYMAKKAEEVSLPEEVNQSATQQPPQDPQMAVGYEPAPAPSEGVEPAPAPSNEVEPPPAPSDEAEYDDSWLDNLTPLQTEPTQQTSQQQSWANPPPTTPVTDVGVQGGAVGRHLDNFDHVDEEVVEELDAKMIAPIRAELDELRAYREREEQQKKGKLIAKSNKVIISRHPQAEKIMGSAQFIEFVNKDTDPYSTERGIDRVSRAYYAGDGEYVANILDKFVEAQGKKPKPKVGVEPHHNGSTTVGTAKKPVMMTDAEYLAKRQAIIGAPRGTYPSDALRKLAEQYHEQKKKGL